MLSVQPQIKYGSGARSKIPENPYKCDQCGRKFKLMGALMQHQVGKNTIFWNIKPFFRSSPTGSTEDWLLWLEKRKIDTTGKLAHLTVYLLLLISSNEIISSMYSSRSLPCNIDRFVIFSHLTQQLESMYMRLRENALKFFAFKSPLGITSEPHFTSFNDLRNMDISTQQWQMGSHKLYLQILSPCVRSKH